MDDRKNAIELIKKKLILWKLILNEELDEYENFKREDIVDAVIQENNQIIYLIQKQKKINTINEINDALKKIENQKYGICENSNEEIEIKRLTANPLAKYTLEIQEILEKNYM